MVSNRLRKQIDKRIKWIEEDANEFKVGAIEKELYDTSEKSSTLSHFSALVIPFKKAKTTVEQILFMEIPIKSEYTNILHLAQPFSHYGFTLNEHPLQLSCVISAKVPSTVIGISEGFIREFKYVTKLEENDPLISLLELDSGFKELRESAFVWKHYFDEAEQFHQKLKWGFQITPLNDSEVVCTINTGIEIEGIFKKKRIYDLHLRFLLLEALMKNVHALEYSGKAIRLEPYAPVHEMMRRELYQGNVTRDEIPEQQSKFCSKCNTRLVEGSRFCSGCGVEVKR